jgi:uncharacterized protein DUF4279
VALAKRTGGFSERETAVQVARAEVIERSWGVSSQILAVHSVPVGSDGEPIVARVDERTERSAYRVYFPIREQPYYLVIVIGADETGRWAVSGVYSEAKVRVYLAVSSQGLSASEITARIGLQPTETRSIGEPIVNRVPTGTYKEHRWMLEPQAGVPGSVEEKIAVLLDAVDGVAGRIAALSPACDIRVTVVFSAWGGDPQFGAFSFGGESVRRLAALAAELSVDLYAFGPRMLEDGAIS